MKIFGLAYLWAIGAAVTVKNIMVLRNFEHMAPVLMK